jgi:hypothetical protein
MYKDGYVTSLDFNHRATRRVDIYEMLMTKFSLPSLGVTRRKVSTTTSSSSRSAPSGRRKATRS